MIHTAVRRFALALVLGASSLAPFSTAHAQGITGTDPMPRGCGCKVVTPTTSTTSTTSTPKTSVAPAADTGTTLATVTQAVLLFLGLA